jgi:hypothetical protein
LRDNVRHTESASALTPSLTRRRPTSMSSILCYTWFTYSIKQPGSGAPERKAFSSPPWPDMEGLPEVRSANAHRTIF